MGPSAGPARLKPVLTAGLYFADDEAGQLFEANLMNAVLESRNALRLAELELAEYFVYAAETLRKEREGTTPRAASRADAPIELFVSLQTRYELQAFDLREKNCHITVSAYADEPDVRAAAARHPYATTAELAFLSQDDDAAVRAAALESLEDRAE